MVTIFIVIAVALLVFLFLVLRSAYRNSHVPVGSVLKRKGILFKVKRYNKSDHIDKCLRCDMRFFPSISGYTIIAASRSRSATLARDVTKLTCITS